MAAYPGAAIGAGLSRGMIFSSFPLFFFPPSLSSVRRADKTWLDLSAQRHE